MNYVISSIILLAIILIIIYILSIDNNTEKIYNKFKELFSVIKSNKVNYLNEKDNVNLLNFIKSTFPQYHNIIIPQKIYYNKVDKKYEMNKINIICYNYINNGFIEYPFTINITFTPTNKDHYIGGHMLFGMLGNFHIDIDSRDKITRHINSINLSEENKQTDSFINTKEDSIYIQNNKMNPDRMNPERIMLDTDVMNMIPDIIHLSEDSCEDTTDTQALISHNLK